MFMLVRNKVADYTRWKQIFDVQQTAHIVAGLTLLHLWQAVDDPHTVFFLFRVTDRARAKAFLDGGDPSIAEQAGVVEGEFHFLTEGQGYLP